MTAEEFQKMVGAMLRGSEKFERAKKDEPNKSDEEKVEFS